MIQLLDVGLKTVQVTGQVKGGVSPDVNIFSQGSIACAMDNDLADLGASSPEGKGAGFDNYCLTTEAFGPVLAVVQVVSEGDEDDTASYMHKACAFANSDDVCGSLSCTLLAPASAPP